MNPEIIALSKALANLRQSQVNIARARWHVQNQIVQVAPVLSAVKKTSEVHSADHVLPVFSLASIATINDLVSMNRSITIFSVSNEIAINEYVPCYPPLFQTDTPGAVHPVPRSGLVHQLRHHSSHHGASHHGGMAHKAKGDQFDAWVSRPDVTGGAAWSAWFIWLPMVDGLKWFKRF